jgi:uncharacterized protein YkwD
MLNLKIWVFIFLLLSGCGKGFKKDSTSLETTRPELSTDQYTINQDYLIQLNQHRINRGLRPLVYNPSIEEEALKHSRSMALYTTTFGHIGFARRCKRIQAKLGPILGCGEVIAMGQRTALQALKSWLNSDLHRQEIENPDYTHTAIALYRSQNGTTYWTQILIEK